jgi:hypothetical protein
MFIWSLFDLVLHAGLNAACSATTCMELAGFATALPLEPRPKGAYSRHTPHIHASDANYFPQPPLELASTKSVSHAKGDYGLPPPTVRCEEPVCSSASTIARRPPRAVPSSARCTVNSSQRTPSPFGGSY